jgi:hypothetical protein
MKIQGFPKNKDHFIKLLEFANNLIFLCKKLNISPIVYGSLALFAYTQNTKMKVNDVDLFINEREFPKLMKILDKNGIKYNYSKEWHVLQIKKGELKVECDSIEFWQKDLPKVSRVLETKRFKTKMVSKETLAKIYKKASEVSKDNSEGNRIKYEAIKSIC